MQGQWRREGKVVLWVLAVLLVGASGRLAGQQGRRSLPAIAPRQAVAPPVTALDYEPTGRLLAAGVYKEVLLLEPHSGTVRQRLRDLPAPVTALAFRRDGRQLAVAVGLPGTPARLLIYSVPANEAPWPAPVEVPDAHQDVILQLAYSPDGQRLATASYDRQVKLWNTATWSAPQVLKEHSDAVYSVAFSPRGDLLASGAADRAVKGYDAQTGRLRFTLSEPTDWVYQVTFSPDGKYLAAAGVDRSIRIWAVSAEGARLVQSAFAHEAAVLRLVYSPQGRTLFSLGEDQVLKAWDSQRLVEQRVYPRQPEAVLSLALSPDGKQLALGRYDGALLLLDAAQGQLQSQPLPLRPSAPVVRSVSPSFGPRGQPLRLHFSGQHLDTVSQLHASAPGVSHRLLAEGRSDTALIAEVTFPLSTPPGVYELRLQGVGGQSQPLSFTVDAFPRVSEQEPNNSPGTGQKISLPATVAGVLDRAGDVDYYRFEVAAGQELGVQVQIEPTGKWQPFLRLTDATGRLLATSRQSYLGYTFSQAGTYALGIQDEEFQGNPQLRYRLHLGNLPVVTAVFPLGLQRGTEATLQIVGVHLGSQRQVALRAAPQALPGSRLSLSLTTPLGPPLGLPQVVVGEFPEVLAQEKQPGFLPVPGTANGRIVRPGQTDLWRFSARKGQPLVLEVAAQRLGTPLDSFLEVLDAQGQPVPRAVLRAVAKTYTTLRDHDSASPGLRLEAWNDFSINDYIYTGNELIRIWELPANPDADCIFFSHRGQRLGYLGTTPRQVSMGTPVYKVAIYPPGTVFPPNGFPVVTLYYRNDDGGPGYGRDSYLYFEPPADGEYLVRLGDARGQGGQEYVYRLTVRPPRPDFQVHFEPAAPAVWEGGAVPIRVTADRWDGFEGPITLRLENVPPGFHAPATTIPAGEFTTAFPLEAEPSAVAPSPKAPPLKLVAEARIGGQLVRREALGQLPRVVPPGEIEVTTDQKEVMVRPGGTTRLTVHIQRRQGFRGRVPVQVLGLPHGVRVLDIGLNGILITERQTERTIVLYCEPWVEATQHPFVVAAQHEGTGRMFAAPPIQLRVEK